MSKYGSIRTGISYKNESRILSSKERSNDAKNRTGKGTQIQFYEEISAASLVYGSENWSLNTSERMRVETAEMRVDSETF